MNQTVNINFNISGNASEATANITNNISQLNAEVKGVINIFDGFKGKIVYFQQLSQFVQNVSQSISSAIQPGIALNTSLMDLSAIAGVTGDKLKEIEGYARDTAKTFGTDAASSVESYKLLLSQLSPELGNYPTALRAMGDNIATLSKTMGGDATAAAEVLTTAMNQYGISMDDPMEASRKMAEMMNVMAAAGKEGSAELPTIKSALEQCGMAAKAAGVSFEETNAAIQVLDKAGKKGSEGGVALRNTMATLSQGRFLPKDVQEELSMAGVDILKLGDKTLSLSDRLNMLKPVMNDTALFTKLFGRENANAAMALVQGTDEINRYTEAISGTNTAEEQAAVIMESFAEKQARIQARFDDIKISIFNATGDLGLWVDVLAKAAVPISQLLPMITALGKGVSLLKTRFSALRTQMIAAGGAANYFKQQLNKVAGNAVRTAVLSLGLAFGSLRYSIMSAGGACNFLSSAIKKIPVIGWILAAISAVMAFFKLLWDKCEGFRRLLFGIWEVIKMVFDWIIGIFSSIGEWFSGLWNSILTGIVGAISSIMGWFKGIFSSIGEWFAGLWNSISTGIRDYISSIVNWVKGIFSKVGEWFSRVMQPIKDWFAGLWDFIKSIFDKIINWLRDIFNPIIEFWNKVTGKVVSTYKVGAEKGSESFNNSQNKGDEYYTNDDDDIPDDPDFGIADPTLPGISNEEINGISGSVPGDVSSGVSATTTGGTRNTNVTINLGKMADVTFNGGVGENAEDMVRKIEECLLRVLYMAQNA